MLFPSRLGGEEAAGPEEEGLAAQAGQAARAVRRVLIGHSMGAVCAVAEAIKHPEVSLEAGRGAWSPGHTPHPAPC